MTALIFLSLLAAVPAAAQGSEDSPTIVELHARPTGTGVGVIERVNEYGESGPGFGPPPPGMLNPPPGVLGPPPDLSAPEQSAPIKKSRRRRTRRSGGATPDTDETPDVAAAPAATATPAAKTSMKAASRKADKIADALKKTVQAPETPASPATRSAYSAPPISAGAAAKPPNPSKPRNEQELLLSEIGGYRAVFERLGLHSATNADGQTSLVDREGRPATPQQLEELRLAVRAQPKALMRRPDFYRVFPREDFDAMKAALKADPGLTQGALKHVKLSKRERDFRWSESCEKLSGACNPHSAATSYRKGDNVAPEDLKAMWKELTEKAEGDDPNDPDDAALRAALAPKKIDEAGLRAIIDGLLSRVAAFFGAGQAPAPSAAASVAPASAPKAAPGYTLSAVAPARPLDAGQPPEPAAPREPAPSRLWLLLLTLPVLLVLFRRRRERRRPPPLHEPQD